MSSSTLHLGALLLAGATLVGCTSLTQSDEVRINKDPPKSVNPEPEPTPAPEAAAPAANALQQARNPLQARPTPKKAGGG